MTSKGYAYAKDSGNVSQNYRPPNRSTAVSEAAPGNQPTHHPLVLHRIVQTPSGQHWSNPSSGGLLGPPGRPSLLLPGAQTARDGVPAKGAAHFTCQVMDIPDIPDIPLVETCWNMLKPVKYPKCGWYWYGLSIVWKVDRVTYQTKVCRAATKTERTEGTASQYSPGVMALQLDTSYLCQALHRCTCFLFSFDRC